MGAETSRLDPTALSLNPNEFVRQLGDACSQRDLHLYTELWEKVQKTRKDSHPEYDDALWDADVMRWVKYALKRPEVGWRLQGIGVARSFFHMQRARVALAKMDFLSYLLVVTLPDENDEEEEEEDGRVQHKQEKDEKAEKEEQSQRLAVETMREMAEHAEFTRSLCSTSVLNFLSIVLNQIPEAWETVTGTFVKLSSHKDNLVMLMEDSVGDILESFFRTVDYERPEDDDRKLWARNLSALSNCAHTLGTLIKYEHQVRVHRPRVIEVLRYTVASGCKRSVGPQGTRLLAEMARLLYWICRRSKDVAETLLEASAASTADRSLDRALKVLADIWETCAGLHQLPVAEVDVSRLKPDSEEMSAHHAQMCLCHMNCLLWVLLPESKIRWKLKRLDLKPLHFAFDLRHEDFLTVVLSTVRHLVDLPRAQECHDLIRFFGEQLLVLAELAASGSISHPGVITLLLDAISILAMQRGMQEMLAEYGAWRALDALLARPGASKLDRAEVKRHQLSVLRTNAEVAMHPSHRLSWVSKSFDPEYVYPPRGEFVAQLDRIMQETDDDFKTIASFLLNTFQEEKFKQPPAGIESTFSSLFDWWQEYTTARYEEERTAGESHGGGAARPPEGLRPLRQLLQSAVARREERRALTSMETLQYCAPYECTFALSLFSRLALEPKFKRLLYERALHALLACVCVGIWAEAREAAATLANLMWLPDLEEERLVCWLKLDSPRCIAVDAANTLLPIKEGNPKPADIGRGMYRSSWGVEFVEGSCITLHPDGLRTHQVPGTLTSASPLGTFEATSRRGYEWLDEHPPDPRHFTVTCWFCWPLNSLKGNKVLLQSAPPERTTQLYLDCEKEPEGVWTLVTVDGEKRTKRPLKTPKLNPGWHMLSIVSSTDRNRSDPFNGTKFFLDDWHQELKRAWVKNEFYMVGNDAGHEGRKPFGLITDFRIYARALSDDEISAMVHSKDTEQHPDKIVRRLAHMDAATILAERLDVPDSAAECLRALGSLATLVSQRAKIYSICGRQVLRMLDSPLPMIQRQAARLLNNIT